MEDYIIDVNNVTVRFNKANMKVDNIKEYVVRLLRRELMFQEFIALKDINLHVKKGEAWGLVGTNGAGKSTLLKVISRILKPYKGTVDVKGSVAALIELGAGIDPNMTARENIFLNGTLLGYKKDFIQEKFDEIVEFSELQDFLDSPVKNFSSGMKARLGSDIGTARYTYRRRNSLGRRCPLQEEMLGAYAEYAFKRHYSAVCFAQYEVYRTALRQGTVARPRSTRNAGHCKRSMCRI